MKIVFTVLVSLLVLVSAYDVKKVPGIDVYPWMVQFDFYGNSYIIGIGYDDSNIIISYTFYKLDINNDIIISQNFSFLGNILINSKDDVYVFGSIDANDSVQSISILKPNSTTLERLYDYSTDPELHLPLSNFIDKEDNLFVNTQIGIQFLKAYQTVPEPINGLQTDLTYFNQFAIDTFGNIFLTDGYTIAQVTKDNKGIIIDRNDVPMRYLITGKNNVYCIQHSFNISLYHDLIYEVRNNSIDLLVDGFGKWLMSDFKTVSDRVYIVAFDPNRVVHVYYLTSNELIEIDETVPYYGYSSVNTATDKRGNFFFTYGDGNTLQIILSRYDETVLTKFDIPNGNFIPSILTDEEDNLWIISTSLYVIEKDSESAQLVWDFQTQDNWAQLKVNKKSNKIFVSRRLPGALYVVSKN